VLSSPPRYDVAIIGAGVVGTAIARALAQHRLDVVLLEAGDDVGAGTSKANTAILHTGFDTKPGTLESRLVRRGYALLSAYGPGAGIPIERIGALLVAWDAEQAARLPEIEANARATGYTGARSVSLADLARFEPHLGPGATGALAIPDEAIICPFTTPLAFATEAVLNGTAVMLGAAVEGRADGDATTHVLATTRGPVHADYVVNAAGLASDEIDRLFGHDGFTVTPRRGELIVYDKLARPLVRHVLLPVPTARTKGVLVSPTVFGNVVLGPTAEDVADKRATASTPAGLARLVEQGRRLVPALVAEEVTAVYVGLRAATEHGDYQIRFHPAERYVCVGGIRSTGLTASMAIAEYVLEGLREAGLKLVPRDDVRTVRMPNLGEAAERPYQSAAMIARDPAYGAIVCHCERVTRGEIRDALGAAVPATTLDGLRRRTRALLGRCQGFYCGATVAALVADATGRTIDDVLGVPDPLQPRGRA
jgi:glycerol-3-phosphate dehydrogenase